MQDTQDSTFSMMMLSHQQCQNARMARDPRFDGKFFILVSSTGIFCRPVCKVRPPLEKNVDYAATAVEAMQRGYRPCLRCRPDALPFSPAWQGIETTAKRAAHLLVSDIHTSVSNIATRLGITPRYLHKLMMQYWQVAPKAFRLYHQVLMAKRLLHDSNMKIEQIADAAGFSSARQLQHHLKQHTRLTPSQIRKGSRQLSEERNKERSKELSISESAKNAETTKTSSMVSVFVAYHPPYNWPKLRDFFARRLIQSNEQIDNDSFTKVICLEDQAILVKMTHNKQKQGFELRFDNMHLAHTPAIIEQVSHILDLHAQPQVIVPALESSGLPKPFIDQGLRIPGICSQFEAGIRAILGQQVTVTAAITQLNRLQEGLSEERAAQNEAAQNEAKNEALSGKQAFLTPEALASSDLSFMRLAQSRKNALWAFAKMFVSKKAEAHQSPSALLQNDALDDWLKIKGIGPWTVNYVRMRATKNTDIWLNTDLIIKQKIAKLNEQLKASTDNTIFNADVASPWRTYLTLNLWEADL